VKAGGGAARVALGAAGFAKVTNVSRETLERLGAYVALLARWNQRINLVGRSTIGDVWRRHILDSAQLFPLIPAEARNLVDLGSGAGLPGLILAIMGVKQVHLVESDQRKAAFLREAVRITGTHALIHAQRIEKIPGFAADVVTARALAALPQLLELSTKFIGPMTTCVFLRGASGEEELTGRYNGWRMHVNQFPSVSDPTGSILRLDHFARDPGRN
jgi:16S rRNA (guanine527-N7)-methyltransferase